MPQLIFCRCCPRRRRPVVVDSTECWPKTSISESRMVQGITIRLTGMKALAVTKQQWTNCVGSPRETDAAWISVKHGFLLNGRHNRYQTYWYDSFTCQQLTTDNTNCTLRQTLSIMAVASGRAGRVLARPPFSQRHVRNLLSLKTAVAIIMQISLTKRYIVKYFGYFNHISAISVACMCVCTHHEVQGMLPI